MPADVDPRQRFESVVDAVYEPLQRYFGRRARPEDVSDLLNEALLVIWRRLDSLPIDDPLAWSYGVAKRTLANHRRGEHRRLRLVGRLFAQPARRDDAIDLHGAASHVELATALDELEEQDRELVRLWAWEQLEPREIAVVLDTTSNAVSLRLSRAKKKLAASIERQNGATAGQEGPGHGTELRS